MVWSGQPRRSVGASKSRSECIDYVSTMPTKTTAIIRDEATRYSAVEQGTEDRLGQNFEDYSTTEERCIL